MDDNQRLKLQNMIAANNVENNTELIRQLKHSHILRQDVNNLVMLKVECGNNETDLNIRAMTECNFLFTYYTDIYNKVRKDEIDLQILFNALDVLKDIEEGVLDQHEGAYQFGLLLKQIYVDSALKKAEKLNAEEKDLDTEKVKPLEPVHPNLSWKRFKTMQK
jgi:hypothetical protein